MERSSARRMIPIVVLGVALLLLSACSSATPTPLPTPTTPIPTPTQIPAPTPTAVVIPPPQGSPGGSLTVAGTADIPHRDVHQEVQEALTALGPGMAYSRLLRLRSGEGLEQPHLLLECDLCESWELTDDLVYEFRLRPGVRWQNVEPVNGRPLVASDLAYSYERLRTPGWPNASLFSSVGAIEAPDDSTLLVELDIADADAILSLADGHSKIVAPEVVAQYGDLKDSPVVGTGPWIWQGTEAGTGTLLLRNPDYFEPGLPFLDELRVAVVKSDLGPGRPDPSLAAAYAAGLVDVASVSPQNWEAFRQGSPSFESTVSRESGSGMMMVMNSGAAALQNQVVRQAVFQAIDPWDYLDTVWEGQGFASVGIPVQRPNWLLERVELRQNYFADPGRARLLLAGTGLSLPIDIEVAVQTGPLGEPNPKLEEKLREDLLAVGFNPALRPMNPQQFEELVIGPAREFQFAVGPVPPTSTTNRFLFALLHSDGKWNIASHNDTGLDALIEQQAAEFDPKRRQRRLSEIQHHVLDQAYLFSPVTATSRWVFTGDLRGFAPNTALSEYNYWSRVWLDRY